MDVLFAGRFAGIPREAFTFFEGLASHNDREWFQANRDVYERACRGPMQRLLAELAPTYGSGRLTRINRDMRFARGQAPYKTFIASGVGRRYYVSLSKDGLYIGTGIYMPDGATLRRLREAIAADASGRKIASIVAALRRKRYAVGSHETTAKARGYDDDHPRVELLRMKDLHAGKQLPPSSLATRKALDRVAAVMSDVKPLSDWLKQYVA